MVGNAFHKGAILSKSHRNPRDHANELIVAVEMGVSKVKQSFSTVRVSVLFIHLVLLLLTDLFGRWVSIPSDLFGNRWY